MTDEVQIDLGKPGYIFNLTANLGNERNLTVTGNLPVDVTVDQINAELDKFTTAINRKQSQAAVPAIEKRVVQMKDMLRNLGEQKKSAEERNAGQSRVPDAEKSNLHNINVDITAKEDMLKYEEQLLERTKKEAE